MGKTKKIGLGGGLSVRYGATLRKRYVDVVSEARRLHRCPQCNSLTVSRKSVGVWICRKCSFTFAGGAYTPVTKLGTTARRTARGIS
ncbi:50S ribosomal protein L37ae [Candidatus Bathyarchaeota archaeon]|jgi:large subunit ribosomal protein L37Ae|nr:50S ribosomal protein L37ae [Candidatus Bathyarchaeota archaeon]MCK5630983.1 50S ribosomal protein L37ae [Candidatus Bathyarchaeota archaeon]